MATRSYLAQQVAVCLWRKKTGLKSQNGAFSQTLRSRMSMTDSPTPLKEGELYSKIVSTFDQKCRMCKSIRKSNASTVLKLGAIRPKIRKRKEWWTDSSSSPVCPSIPSGGAGPGQPAVHFQPLLQCWHCVLDRHFGCSTNLWWISTWYWRWCSVHVLPFLVAKPKAGC